MKDSKILIVEDSKLLQNMYTMLFRKYRELGAELILAENGKVGLLALETNRNIKLVILDMNMPEMNGMEFLEFCKRGGLLLNIPVIVVCTMRPGDDAERFIAAGATAFLEKPFKGEELTALIDRYIKS